MTTRRRQQQQFFCAGPFVMTNGAVRKLDRDKGGQVQFMGAAPFHVTFHYAIWMTRPFKICSTPRTARCVSCCGVSQIFKKVTSEQLVHLHDHQSGSQQ